MSSIMVVAEHRDGAVREATLEVLGAALDLGRTLGLEVVTLVLGHDPRAIAAPLVGRAPSLRLLAHPELRCYEAERYLAALIDQISASTPKLVLMAHSSQGMDLVLLGREREASQYRAARGSPAR